MIGGLIQLSNPEMTNQSPAIVDKGCTPTKDQCINRLMNADTVLNEQFGINNSKRRKYLKLCLFVKCIDVKEKSILVTGANDFFVK